MCLWDLLACSAAWWWRPIQPAKRRVGLASRVAASSTNSSSPICRNRRSPPLMSSSCICIAAPLSLLLLMRMSNKTQIAGVVSRPLVRSAGRSFHNGCGTCAWNWDISLSQPPCARPSLLLPSRRKASRLPTRLLPRLAMVHPPRHPPRKAGRFSGKDFAFQPDGTLKCPAGKILHPTEQRTEHDGSLRLLYAARIGDCRACPLREQCQWHGRETTKPRRVSLLLHPLPLDSAPLLWQDWSRRAHRRACMHLLRRQRVDVTLEPALPSHPKASPPILSRAQRAHYRLSFAERLARNARDATAARPTITLFGVPDTFAAFLGLSTLQ